MAVEIIWSAITTNKQEATHLVNQNGIKCKVDKVEAVFNILLASRENLAKIIDIQILLLLNQSYFINK